MRKIWTIAAVAVMSLGAFSMASCGEENNKPNSSSNEVQKVLKKIAVTTRPKLKYFVGEKFDPTGMVVTATYSDGTEEEVTDYTWDKTGPLTVKDNSITIMYQGKLAFLPLSIGIELQEMLTIPNAENNIYTIEAESLDYSHCDNSNVAGSPPSQEASKDSSGGFSMGALAVPGNMFGFKVKAEEECTIDFVVRGSAVGDNIVVDDCMTVTLNDKVIRSEHTLTWGGDGHWWDWEHIYYRGIKLNKGDNEILFKINTVRVPNFDCFYIVTSPIGDEPLGPGAIKIPPTPDYAEHIKIENAERNTYTVEAEDLDLSLCQSSNHPGELPNFEEPATETSGGKCVSSLGVPSNRFGFTVNSDVEADIAIVMRVSNGKPEDQELDEILRVAWNEQELKTGKTLIWENKWHDWKEIRINNLKLNKGKNVFDFFVKKASAPNVDCFKILVDPEPESEIPDEPKNEFGTFANVETAENHKYLIEAEALSYAKCESSNFPGQKPGFENPPAEKNTSGGICVSQLGRTGNRLGFTVESKVAATANLTLRVSAGAPADQNLNDLIKLTWNEEEYRTDKILKNPQTDEYGWHNWEDATMYELPLVAGDNFFSLDVVGDGCPNIDCFILEVSPDNTGVEIPDKPDSDEFGTFLTIENTENQKYIVEAEALDYSKCVNSNFPDQQPAQEAPDASKETSGGLCVSALGVDGNRFGFAVDSKVAGTANLTLRVSSGAPADQNLDKLVRLTWNKEEYVTNCVTKNPVIDDYGWHNWVDATMYNLPIKEGKNVFAIDVVGGGCPNIDCFILEVSPDNTGVEIPVKIDYATKLDITTGDHAEYKIEGESLDLDKCAEGARYEGVGSEFGASGNFILSSIGKKGNKVGFTVKSAVSGKIKLTMRCAAGGNGVQVLDDIIKINWNGVEHKTGARLEDPQIIGWHQFVDVAIADLDLRNGANVFEIEVLDDAAPNFDYFLIEVLA